MFKTQDKVRLRYGAVPAQPAGAPKGTICLVQGRTEFIEKYFETIADFQRRGFQVATFDWRGQGGSERLIRNPRLGYVEHFDDYWTDLASFHAEILLPDCPPPFYLVGAFDGRARGAVRGRARPHDVRPHLPRRPRWWRSTGSHWAWRGWHGSAETLCFFGLGRAAGRRGRPTGAPSERTFAGNPLTSDLTRYMRSVEVLAARPDLAIGAPTLRWSAAAMRAMAIAGGDDFPMHGEGAGADAGGGARRGGVVRRRSNSSASGCGPGGTS